MKRIKFSLFAAAIAIGIAGTVAAALPAKEQPVSTVYHYTSNSNSLAEMKKIQNWEIVDPEEEQGCGLEGTVPCTFTYSGNFATYLNGFTNATTLINTADTRRTP